jgi:hypothetical protein
MSLVEQELLTLQEHLISKEEQTTKGQSESVYQRRTDNKGAIRICISKKNRQHADCNFL